MKKIIYYLVPILIMLSINGCFSGHVPKHPNLFSMEVFPDVAELSKRDRIKVLNVAFSDAISYTNLHFRYRIQSYDNCLLGRYDTTNDICYSLTNKGIIQREFRLRDSTWEKRGNQNLIQYSDDFEIALKNRYKKLLNKYLELKTYKEKLKIRFEDKHNIVSKKVFNNKIELHIEEKSEKFSSDPFSINDYLSLNDNNRIHYNVTRNISYGNDTYNIAVNPTFNYMPSEYRLNDKFIDVKVSNIGKVSEMKIENKTEKFLKVNSISSYYNGNIVTIKNINLDLPPQGIKSYSLNSFSHINDYRGHFLNIKSKSQKIDYGFAINYSITDLTKVKTLYKTNKYEMKDFKY